MNTLERVDVVQPQQLEDLESQDWDSEELDIEAARSPFGFTRTAEILNGRLAMLGFTVLLGWALLHHR
jgi:hypothetical protein